jgi:hypothetical protein
MKNLIVGIVTLAIAAGGVGVAAPTVICEGGLCRVIPVASPEPARNVVSESPLVPVADPSIGGVYQSTATVYASAEFPVVGSVMSDGGIVTSVSYSESVSQPTYTTRRRERIESRGRWFPGKGFVRWLRR